MVAGGCGFNGAEVFEAFVDDGHDVAVVDLNCWPFRRAVTLVDPDVSDAGRLIGACARADTVVYVASMVQTLTGNEDALWRVKFGSARTT